MKTSSARKSSRKKICEILRNSGNLEPATNLLHTRAKRRAILYKENDWCSGLLPDSDQHHPFDGLTSESVDTGASFRTHANERISSQVPSHHK